MSLLGESVVRVDPLAIKWGSLRLFIPHFPPHSPISALRQRAFRPRPESLSRPSFLNWSSTVLIQSRLTLGQAACRRHRSISRPVSADVERRLDEVAAFGEADRPAMPPEK